jgi:glycosyltransferase involved in cell wall biosynthesis
LSAAGEQLRVALLSPCFWPEVRRGSERFTRELADGLLARGQHPELITSTPGRPSYEVEDGLPILRLPRPSQRRLVRRQYEPYITHWPLSYAALRLRPGGYDIAHSVYPADALAAVRWGQKTGRPSILSYMGIPDRKGLRWKRKRLEILQAVLNRCDAVVALSQYVADAFDYWLGYEARVIYPGVDLENFRRRAERSPQPTIICSAAVGEPRKAVRLLVQALPLVRKQIPDVRLVLSRPRSWDEAVHSQIDVDAPGLEWVDLDDRETLARAYSDAWVAALPSWGEAFGLVLVEAMACGTPVVGYADGALPEVIDRPEVGRLFDEQRPESLAEALIEALALSEDPATGERCRARAAEFSTDACTERYLALYGELLSA